MPAEEPIEQSHGVLETACPMRSLPPRTLLEPRVEKHSATFCVFRIVAQVPCLGQRHQFGMTTGLPQVLDVSDQGFVPIVERLAEAERRESARLGIPIPLRRESQLRRFHGKDMKLASQDCVGGVGIFRN
jgi:hypothetical protein